MDSLREASWEKFTLTGNIEAYLLYKTTADKADTEIQEDKDDTWQKSEQEALS